jgi:hypothetical protein
VDLDDQAGVPPSALVYSCSGGCGSIEIRVGGYVWKSIHGMLTLGDISEVLQAAGYKKEMNAYRFSLEEDEISSVSFLLFFIGPWILVDNDIATLNELREPGDCSHPLSFRKTTSESVLLISYVGI